MVRKSFKQATAEKPGVSFISFPENIAQSDVEDCQPLLVQSAMPPEPPAAKVRQAAEIISAAKFPIVLAGNGVIRGRASAALLRFAERLKIPVATTFMAKGAIPFSNELSLGAVGLQAHDYVACGFDRADVVICVGYDMVEYPPALWNRDRTAQIVHIDMSPAEVDAAYVLAAGVIGNLSDSLDGIAALATPQEQFAASTLREMIVDELSSNAEDASFPLKPQKILADLRKVLEPEDIVVSDVGAHKMWVARMYPTERPNTCIISNGFASMGIGLPGAMAAKLCHPDRTAVTVTGDAGFLMNVQELETAVRIGAPIIVLIWNDSKYGLIEWHQLRHFGRPSHIDFGNPDFVMLAESFGARGYRVTQANELEPILRQAIADGGVAVIDCPVDYSENMKLTERLGQLVCPI